MINSNVTSFAFTTYVSPPFYIFISILLRAIWCWCPSFLKAYFIIHPFWLLIVITLPKLLHHHQQPFNHFLSRFCSKSLQNLFLPLCIYKNGQKNWAKIGHFSAQFLPSNHNILWFRPSISSLSHNTASLLLPQHAPSLETYPLPSPS